MASIPRSPGDEASGRDEAAAHALFVRLDATYRGQVLRFFRARGFSAQDALDLTQDVFVRVFKNIDNLRAEEATRAWILKITANVWKNEVRRLRADKRDRIVVSLDSSGTSSDPGEFETLEVEDRDAPASLDDLVTAETVASVRSALGELPSQMRRCLMLFTHGGRKYKEISALLGIKIDTVKSHIHQGRQKLKDRLRSH